MHLKWTVLISLISVFLASVTWSQMPLYWGNSFGPTLQNILNAMTDFIIPIFNAQRSMTHFREDKSSRTEFDFIIVGSGASGSALVNRLSEVSDWNILVLEAGGEEVPIMTIPYFLGQFYATDANWQYLTTVQNTTCVALVDSRCDYPQGRALGGSTTINYMFNIRGNRRDFDNWAAMGNEGWSFEDVLPYFKRVEDVRIPQLQSKENRGYGGRIKTTYPSHFSNMGKLLLRGAREAGFETPEDYNNGPQTGFSRIQTTTFRGERWSANRGYLRQARNRANVFLRPRSFVTRLLFDAGGSRVIGVRYVQGSRQFDVFASKEVILSAGAVNSPALLMRSGVGPAQHLHELGIPLIKDLPVGYNLMDHSGVVLFYFLNETVAPSVAEVLLNPQTHMQYFSHKSGPLTTTGTFETLSFHDLKGTPYHSPDWPDIEILYSSVSPVPNEKFSDLFRFPRGEFVSRATRAGPMLAAAAWRLRPKSRGRVYLKDRDPFSSPQIDPNSYENDEDVEVVLAGVREFQKLIASPSLQRVGARLFELPTPGCESFIMDSDDFWRCTIKQLSLTIYHPSGTAKMAPAGDPSGVVTPDLKVVGIKSLRVVDSSIPPLLPSGHLQLTSYMIGEKMSDAIKKEYGKSLI